ncbi:hypothetical protein C2S52_009274 [Perilla frutescens var. hirtella]|nr:hypothetical protein C2S51_017224 [Perilla frutescens var. frutescens]KAH6784315.1 hypothetical protein C2S52_009274 [Perilla frutescens var. hirtella]
MGPIKTELVPDFTDIFQTMELFDSREDLISWVRERGIPVGIVVIVRRSDAGSDTRNPRLVLSCERGGYSRVIKKKPPTERDYIQQNLDDDDVSGEGKERTSSRTSSRETGSKRIGCSFHLKGQYLPEYNQWMLEVVCGVHNHPQAQYLEGHAYAGRLTSDEEKLYTKRCPQTDTVKDMFYAHPISVKLLRAFPEVLLMDCTYKTNRYRLPLFEIVGVTSTSMMFSVSCAYLEVEKENNYIWALTVLKGLMDQSTLPSVIVTDRERALMNAIEHGMVKCFGGFKKTMPPIPLLWIMPLTIGLCLTKKDLAEGAHAKLKRFLGTSTDNLEGCWEKIHDLLETSFNTIKASFENSVNVVQHRYRKLDMEPTGAKVAMASDIDNRWFETWTCANNMFAQADESARLLMLKRFREIVTPSTTSMVEPDEQTKTRGRPKVTKTKADTSTKREKSAFEYTDSFNDSCSQVPDSFEVDTSLSQVLFTTRPQKQKVIRPKASHHLGIGYIDQISASFRGYVTRTEDVTTDGYCGFRVIVGWVLGD